MATPSRDPNSRPSTSSSQSSSSSPSAPSSSAASSSAPPGAAAGRRVALILHGDRGDDSPEIDQAIRAFRSRPLELEVLKTRQPGDGGRLVAEWGPRVDTVVAGGGDGTLHEVAAGLLDLPAEERPSLGILPLGTGNDFARAARIPLEPGAALDLVGSSTATAIDVLKVEGGRAASEANGAKGGGPEDGAGEGAPEEGGAAPECRWVVNMATGGLGTEVTLETPEDLKKRLGRAAYFLTGLQRITSLESSELEVRGPDGFSWQGPILALAVGNGRQAGGGVKLCPEALLGDGLLDVTLFPGDRPLEAVLDSLLSDEAFGDRVTTARLPWVEVSAPRRLHLNLDGEPVVGRRFRIEVAPGALAVHLPDWAPVHGPSPGDPPPRSGGEG